jgi:hypothetical protein
MTVFIACTGSEEHALSDPEHTTSPQLPGCQDSMTASKQSLQYFKARTFNVHESPAMGLLRPPTTATFACHTTLAGCDLADLESAAAGSLSQSTSLLQTSKPPNFHEETMLENSHPTDEVTLLSVGSHAARSVVSEAAVAPVLSARSPTYNESFHRSRDIHTSSGELRGNPSFRSPCVRHNQAPESATCTRRKEAVAAPERPDHSSSFIECLRRHDSTQKVCAGSPVIELYCMMCCL